MHNQVTYQEISHTSLTSLEPAGTALETYLSRGGGRGSPALSQHVSLEY
jgi:hypothetical protein